tara:strand:+ start:196 stop:423 length:228 start_codon:yes stop_codon:yes gene_type:complete
MKKNNCVEKNIILESVINYLKEDDVKQNIKEIIKPLIEVILIELYPYLFYFILIFLVHISLTIYIIYITIRKMEN